MTNRQRYDAIFIETLALEPAEVQSATAAGLSRWDSLGQMGLIAALEEAFDIELEPEDVMAFDSYAAGADMLKAKGIVL